MSLHYFAELATEMRKWSATYFPYVPVIPRIFKLYSLCLPDPAQVLAHAAANGSAISHSAEINILNFHNLGYF